MNRYDYNREWAATPAGASFRPASRVTLAALACLYLTSCGQVAVDGERHGLVGNSFPALDVEPLVNSSSSITLPDVAGQVVLINFWGPWCVPCRVEMPHIVALEQQHRGRDDFRLVSISCASTPEYALQEETERYVETQGIEFPVYSDSEGKTRWPLMDAIGSQGEFTYPTTVLIDRQANVCGFWSGYSPGLEKEVAAAVEQALSE